MEVPLGLLPDFLYFTDSGAWGETSIENPKGSVFAYDIQLDFVRPLALNCLAYPTGMALTNNDNILYVCETGKNRILRFNLKGSNFSMFSIFYQFSGRFGPTAITAHSKGNLYAAHFEYAGRHQ